MKTRLRTHLVPCLKDNYAYIIEDTQTAQALVVDPSEAEPVSKKLKLLNLKLVAILNTHHHDDHIGGNLGLKAEYDCQILCSDYDRPRIPGADRGLKEGETFNFAEDIMTVIDIPGHTLGHIALYFKRAGFVFTGDTMFSAGCGRLFEGTPAQMFSSLAKLATLPDTTQVFCGHEYTLSNLVFAKTIEPENQAIHKYWERVQKLRARRTASIPSTIELEKQVNLFVRASSVERLAEIRKLKDEF